MFNIEKNQNFEKLKNPPGDIIILYICIINGNHMMYGFWEIECDRQNFLSFWTVFALLPTCGARKSKFWIKKKKKKNTWRYYHFIYVYHKWQSLDAWLLRHGVQRTEFNVVLSFFLPFHPCNNQKSQNFVKMKKMHGDTIILHMCAINDNHMMYGS